MPRTAQTARATHGAGAAATDSWYLDRLVALQKREANLGFIRRWSDGFRAETVLKTDLFEEANGQDRILFDLDRGQSRTLGFDWALPTVRKAAEKGRDTDVRVMAADARKLPLPPDSVDLILSTSTLDHFNRREDFLAAIRELARILKPGGRLLLTMDNPANPTYLLLRIVCRLPNAPFTLGYTPGKDRLGKDLEQAGLRCLGWEPLLHNPRLFSTMLYMALRRTLGERGDGPIRSAMGAFARLDALPTRWWTCCFNAVCAEKPAR